MVCQKAVHGLDIFAPKEFDYLCNECKNGKSYYLPLPGSSVSQYSKIKLLIMDLTRPMFITTWDGYLYMLVVIEVSCCYIVSCLLKKKKEAIMKY